MNPSEAVRRAAQILGSKAELARRLKVSTPTVSQWCSGGRPIPPKRAIAIESATDRQVTRQELCPDFPWDEAA